MCLCLKTNAICEWPIFNKKALFLPQNSINLEDFDKSKNLMLFGAKRKRESRELELDHKEIVELGERKVPNQRPFVKHLLESREKQVEDCYVLENNPDSINRPDSGYSINSYERRKELEKKNETLTKKSDIIVTRKLNYETSPLSASGTNCPIFNVNEYISPSSENSFSGPAPEYQDLYRTLRDFMFLNAASRDAQSPIQIPPDLNNVDIDNHFNYFLNNNDNNSNTQGHVNFDTLPHIVSGTSLSNVDSRMDRKDTKYMFQIDESLTKHLPIKESITNNQNVIDEIKLDFNYFELFTHFVEEVAGWLDMFDRKKHFTTVILNLSRECAPLYYSILALSSRQLDKTGKSKKERTYALYERSLYYLVPLVNDRSSIEVVASCIILCVFEMMDSSPTNLRKRLKGCAALLTAYNMHGQGSPLERSLFWCFLRMDICNAVINGEPTLLPLRKWGDQSLIDKETMNNMDITAVYREKFITLSSYDFDMYSNYIVFLAARTVNLIEGGENFVTLYHELLEWYINRPSSMKPIACHVEREEFPKLFFSNSPGTSSNQMYHMLMILMNTNKPRIGKKCKLDGIKHLYRNQLNNVWHAKRIIGISLLNIKDHGCLTNALQPIYIAGKVLTGHNEHETVLKLLQKIEEVTGWVCSWRMNELIELWNDNI